MKKLYIAAITVILFNCAFTSNKALTPAHLANDTLKVSLKVKHANDTLKADNITAQVEFTNVSAAGIRLPGIFKDANTYLSVTSGNDRIVTPIKLAMVDYSDESPSKYITLAPRKSFKHTINISDILKSKNVPLAGGTYKLEVCYINNKGADCIKGTYYSNAVTFIVAQTPLTVTLIVTKQAPQKQVAVSNVVTFTAVKDTLHVKPFKPSTKSTNRTGTFTDKRDGQTYTWVKIGKHTWMSQNLNYKSKVGVSYYYNNDSTNTLKYGVYYSYAALHDAAPKGWHVPTDAEWQDLEIEGGIPATEVTKMGWNGDDISAFLVGGSTGFNVLYAGRGNNTAPGHVNERAYFWTTREPGEPLYIFRRIFIKSYNRVMRATQGIAFNLNLRCVKDE
ncbi:uncharacterized protein (TIGR02145 family) [Mucilaginibacter gracilis]|uniref:Uncharacterized protein (TIGR02145 family) n=1 Tax=Mucilaginibacter gracilis TaxID=423350 RepID=A0A495J271_9SPHI|nr:FISUMP domain-containing protein [Mucilaginibacter gracilis]RKR83065.1 uncharacterized protein (TIGR02145 family) [Mucilaginibacter gracilis]